MYKVNLEVVLLDKQANFCLIIRISKIQRPGFHCHLVFCCFSALLYLFFYNLQVTLKHE